MKRFEVTGINDVVRNLNREIRNIENRTRAGMREAALVVRKRSQELTPVDKENLKASAYTTAYNTLWGPAAEIGYTASYAIFVHEIPPPFMTGVFQRSARHHPPGQWKFLGTALIEKRMAILDIIRRRAAVPAG